MSTRLRMALMCTGFMLAIAGCSKKAPEGQVVAELNGKEITLQEVNAELQGANVPDTADKKGAMQTLLQRVIDRKLIDDAAHEQGLDTSAEYLTQKRRADETLLAQLYAKQQASTMSVPTPGDITKFMADNPTMFAQRERLTLDQIRFPRPSDTSALKALEGAHSMEGVAKTLTDRKITFQRGTAGLDTASVPPLVMKQINALPPGEPFVVPGTGIISVSAITGRSSAPLDDAQARAVAVNAWREQQFEKSMSDKLKMMRDAAKISYQPGFEPAAANTPSAAPASPKAPGAP